MYKQILCPIDLNETEGNKKALKTAVQLAEAFGATINIITVIPDYISSFVGSYLPHSYEENVSNEVKDKLEEYVLQNIPSSINVNQIVAHGTIYNEIIDTANKLNVDLIVMASHRPELKDYLVGPNAARVFRHADCSTMVVRS